jgi:hypothetical protein
MLPSEWPPVVSKTRRIPRFGARCWLRWVRRSDLGRSPFAAVFPEFIARETTGQARTGGQGSKRRVQAESGERRAESGERLKRAAWPAPIHGDLLIYNAEECMVATLEKPGVDERRLQVLYPLFDVRVRTLGDGLLVSGYRINADTRPVREYRQAWFCVPSIRA